MRNVSFQKINIREVDRCIPDTVYYDLFIRNMNLGIIYTIVNFVHSAKIFISKIEIKNVSNIDKPFENNEAFEIVKNDIFSNVLSKRFVNALRAISFKDLRATWVMASDNHVRDSEFSQPFREEWTTRSHRIREAFTNDRLLTTVLWNVLPSYTGHDLFIWRGEQTARFNAGVVGFNWSTDRDSANLFASGLCTSYPGGGTLLKAQVNAEGIISGYGKHTIDPEEKGIVVDPACIIKIESIIRYPEVRTCNHD